MDVLCCVCVWEHAFVFKYYTYIHVGDGGGIGGSSDGQSKTQHGK